MKMKAMKKMHPYFTSPGRKLASGQRRGICDEEQCGIRHKNEKDRNKISKA